MAVENIGVQNYATVMPPQMQSIPQEEAAMPPMVYDEALEEKKKASSNMLGATIMGILTVAGLGFGLYKNHQLKNVKLENAELGQKLDTAIKQRNKEWSLKGRERLARFFRKNAYLSKDEIELAKEAREARKAAEKANKKSFKDWKIWHTSKWFKKADKADKK